MVLLRLKVVNTVIVRSTVITKRKTIEAEYRNITDETVEVSIIDKEQHQETVVIHIDTLVLRRIGLSFRKAVTFDHAMAIVLTNVRKKGL